MTLVVNSTGFEETVSIGGYYIDVPRKGNTIPVAFLEHHKARTEEVEDDYQRINPDMTIRIPQKVADKLHWKIGAEVWVDVLDEDLSQIIVGKRMRGEEAERALRRLEDMADKK